MYMYMFEYYVSVRLLTHKRINMNNMKVLQNKVWDHRLGNISFFGETI